MARATATAATATPKKAKDQEAREAIHIAKLKRSHMTVFLMGESPLIVHAWSQKARLEMLKKHMQFKIAVREAKDPYEHFLRTIYRMDDGAYGFPVVGVKEAMATATADLEGIFRPDVYRNVAVTGRRGFQFAAFADLKVPQELAELFSPNAPTMREDMVRLSDKARTPDIRYRAEFWPWAMHLNLGFLPDFINAESILNLVEHGGIRIGLGEWRIEKGGTNGSFHVATEEERTAIAKWMKAGQKEPERVDVAAWMKAMATADEEKHPAPLAPMDVVAATGKRKAKGGNGKTEKILGRHN